MTDRTSACTSGHRASARPDTKSKASRQRLIIGAARGAAFILLVYLLYIASTIDVKKLPHRYENALTSIYGEQNVPTTNFGCKHFYFDLGTNNALSIEDFIMKPATDARGNVVRPLNQYRNQSQLKMSDFCVFGFEPNPAHSANHRRVEKLCGTTVRHVEIFSETIAGISDGKSVLQIDNYNGHFPSWGSSVLAGFGPIAKQANTTTVSVQSLDFGRFLRDTLGEKGALGKVILRMDIEGSEYILLRRYLDMLCKYVDHLEIEWHAHQLNPAPLCVETTFRWMLSDEQCKPNWPRPANPSGCNPWIVSDAFSG
jgi:hypothetical protein